MLNKLKTLLALRSPAPAPASEVESKRQGDHHLNLGEFDQAVTCYRRAISINAGFVEAHVGLGFSLAEQHQLEEAETALKRALSINPAVADAHYLLGTISKKLNDPGGSIRHFAKALELNPNFEFAYRDCFDVLLQSGKVEDAKVLMQQGILAIPESAEFHFLLGNLLFNHQDFEGAISCHEKVVRLEPSAAMSYKILGDAHRHLEHLEKSVGCYRTAISLDPHNADAHAALGDGLSVSGGNEEAITCYRRAIDLNPEHVMAHRLLGNALLGGGDKEGAIACYRRVVELQPDSPVAHLVAAMSGVNTDTAPSGYVEQLFDDYAQTFDSHLVQTLRYNVPEKLVNLVCELTSPEAGQWSVLDLGCGTGLSGAAVTSYAKELVGVDLSRKMLAKAEARNIYSRLEHADLLSMMQKEASASYDVVISADVFVYIGKLDDLFYQVRRLLRAGGLFAFSVESLDALSDEASALQDARDFQLNTTGRYAHSMAYLSRTALHNGLDVLNIRKMQGRMNHGKEVQGCLMLCRCLADAPPLAG